MRIGIIALLAALVLFSEANAYTHTGFKFDHLEITYSCGNPELEQAVQAWAEVSALEDGGCSDNPDITLYLVPNSEIASPIEGLGGAGQVILPVRNEHFYGIMLHEVAHALGMGHSAEVFSAPYVLRKAAMFAYCCNPINEDDIEGIQALYGSPPAVYHMVIGGLSAD